MIMPYQVQYGSSIIHFTLVRKERKAIKISVLPELTVEVLAPPDVTIEKIKEKVRKKGAWIFKNFAYFSQFLPREPVREFVGGETHKYLGRQYRLKIVKDKEESVKLKGCYIVIKTNGIQNANVRSLLDDWYLGLASRKFAVITDKCCEKLRKYKVDRPKVRLRKLKSRWGSCSKKTKTILLNTELIKVPTQCIEYVIIHELCHLKYFNHDKRFYSLMSSVMPDWEKRKDKLEKSLI